MFLAVKVGATTINLQNKNTVIFRGEVNNYSVSKAKTDLATRVAFRGKKKYPIYLVIDSRGGYIDSGLNFIQYTKKLRNIHTITIFAASMASAIVQQLPGKRYMIDTGTMMFHRAYGSVSGQFEVGEVESKIKYMKDRVKFMEKRNAKRIRISLKKYKELVVNEWWIYGEDSIHANVADEVIDIVCHPKLIVRTEKILVKNEFFYRAYKYSSCPLFRYPLIKGRK